MARKRKVVDESITTKIDSTPRTRKRFVGVRQRPSGRWVAEIKDTIQKIRVWLGTFDTAEEAARAYDEAAYLLRGANTRTNFWPSPNSSSSPALPSKITNLLLSRLQARNNTLISKNVSSPSYTNEYEYVDKYVDETPVFQESNFPDFLIHDDSLENISSFTSDPETKLDQPNSLDLIQESNDSVGFDSSGLEDVDFRFVDEMGCSSVEYSPFVIAEEISKRVDSEDEEAMMMMSEAMKRMNYERKNSASLYAFNGINEYLNLKMKKSERSDHLTRLSDVCKSKQEEMMMMKRANEEEEREDSSDVDAEFSLWSSIDLPPICFVN